jgi:hypothetical protein
MTLISAVHFAPWQLQKATTGVVAIAQPESAGRSPARGKYEVCVESKDTSGVAVHRAISSM